jgi:phosphoribosylaminoimidazole-succinocarboxamide synthase
MRQVVLQTELSLPVRRGKVRDVYDLGDRLLLVATDRISAFDWVLPTGIPDKGRVLTQTSLFWFQQLREPHHLLAADVETIDLPAGVDRAPLAGRTMLVRKTEVVPIECVVRGYLSGSGWKEYRGSGSVCGLRLPAGLQESDPLPEPIFTPATKAEAGAHDQNISFEQTVALIGAALAEQVREVALRLYREAAEYALGRGIVIADTKFEFGLDESGTLTLMDEILTPDSSRFWPREGHAPGANPPSFDKQFLRDWLESVRIDGRPWDKAPPAPALPDTVRQQTAAKYAEALRILGA